jgi:hypothetical protein
MIHEANLPVPRGGQGDGLQPQCYQRFLIGCGVILEVALPFGTANIIDVVAGCRRAD